MKEPHLTALSQSLLQLPLGLPVPRPHARRTSGLPPLPRHHLFPQSAAGARWWVSIALGIAVGAAVGTAVDLIACEKKKTASENLCRLRLSSLVSTAAIALGYNRCCC